MKLNDALEQIAEQLALDAEQLISDAAKDEEGGFNLNLSRSEWPMGSIWDVEGRFLHAIVRGLKPSTVVEVGTFAGCGAKHILTAMTTNRKGKLISVDIAPAIDEERFTPAQLDRWEVIKGDWLEASLPKAVDIVFEDATHELPFTTLALKRAKKLKPKLIISHDGAHHVVGQDVQTAYTEVFGAGNYTTVLIEPSDCGFCYWIDEEQL